MMTLWPRRIILSYVGLSVHYNNRSKELSSLTLCLHLVGILSCLNMTDVHLVQLRCESHQVDQL